jgi:hypothetical protein
MKNKQQKSNIDQPVVSGSAIYKAGDRVEIIKTGDKGVMWIINGRWVNIKLDKGETYKCETDEIRYCH